MDRVTVDDVPSRPYRFLEAVFLFPVGMFLAIGLALLVLPFVAGSGDSGAQVWGLVFAGGYLLFVGLLILMALVTPVLIYLDAKAVSRANMSWDPSPVLYAVLAFFFTWLTVAHYLYKRHQYVIDRSKGDWWWTLIAGSLLLAIAGAVVPFLLAPALGIDSAVASLLPFGLGYLASMLVGLGIYFDSRHVRLHSEWQPNPGTYAGLTLMFGVLPIVSLLCGVFYLARRKLSYQITSPF